MCARNFCFPNKPSSAFRPMVLNYSRAGDITVEVIICKTCRSQGLKAVEVTTLIPKKSEKLILGLDLDDLRKDGILMIHGFEGCGGQCIDT